MLIFITTFGVVIVCCLGWKPNFNRDDVFSSKNSHYLITNKLKGYIPTTATSAIIAATLIFNQDIAPVQAVSIQPNALRFSKEILASDNISPAIKLARQKRNVAIKQFEDRGILKVDTDDTGNQFLRLPWLPNQKILYKSMTLQSKLWSELCAGALGKFLQLKYILLFSH
jgi:hypothetical protein